MTRATWMAGLAGALSAAAVGLWTTGAHADIIQIDGSSTVYPITEAVAEEFQIATSGVTQVTVGISGTGGGFKKFCRGDIDISDASRPIKQKEMDACRENNIRYIELPMAFDALTVVINPQNTWASCLTVDELKKAWEPAAQGTVTSWNQIRGDFPSEPLRLYGPGSDSGTFDYFTEAVMGQAAASRGDYTASEDDNVLVQGVTGDVAALGYFGYAYYAPYAGAALKAAAIDGGQGCVEPSLETVIAGSYVPLSRPIFIYVNETAAERPDIAEFVEFYLANAAELVTEVGYVPLPDKAYQMALDRFRKREVGTGFHGKAEVGLPVEDLLNREPSL